LLPISVVHLRFIYDQNLNQDTSRSFSLRMMFAALTRAILNTNKNDLQYVFGASSSVLLYSVG